MAGSRNSRGRFAFVIPAFKGKFLQDTLQSLAAQTNQEFFVYIGDDASAENLKQIVAAFEGTLSLHYERFENNLGQNSLVRHWERCVGLSSEPFFCVFGDDDVIDPSCVADLYATLDDSNENYDVYRFNNAVIDEHGELVAYSSPTTQVESHKAFLYSRLQHRRISFMSSYVIRRKAYLRERGFVDFPLAWLSDDASVIMFSRLTGIRNIAGHPAYWRLSGENVSSARREDYLKKIDSNIRYVKWLDDKFGREIIGDHSWHSKETRMLIERWFFRQLEYAGCYPLGISKLLSISAAISPYCNSNMVALFLKLNRHTRGKFRKFRWIPIPDRCRLRGRL